MKEQRRSTLKKLFASAAGLIGLGIASAKADATPEKEVFNVVKDDQDVPLFSGSTKFNNLVFIAGKGARPTANSNRVRQFSVDHREQLPSAGYAFELVLAAIVERDP